MRQDQKELLRLIAADGKNVGTRASAKFGISRQAVSARLASLTNSGLIAATGHSRSRVYALKSVSEVAETFETKALEEDRVWRGLCAPVVADLPENVRNIWHYGITEMVNNAIDHAASPTVRVGMTRTAIDTTAWVSDVGEGIFLKIQKALNLHDPRESILELAKGKLTTDPTRHTGEGIFFSSKMFDVYDIRSGNLHFLHDAGLLDILAEREREDKGTLVMMRLANDSTRTTNEVFETFAGPDEFTFDKTIVPVRLAVHEGEKLVSRSQAKRITLRFEKFRHVILDFQGVSEIGQAFADEIFRVFQAAHPTVNMVPTNMTEAVRRMVSRALASAVLPPL